MHNPVFNALWGHYRRHPLQMVLLLLGLIMGIALLVGVLAVNQQARSSYRAGEMLFKTPFRYAIRHEQAGMTVPQGLYIQLRRMGYTQCVPYEMHRIETAEAGTLTLVGIDPLVMLPFSSSSSESIQSVTLIQTPGQIWISRQLAQIKQLSDGQRLTLNTGREIGRLALVDDDRIHGARLLADMGLVRQLFPRSGFNAVFCGQLSPDEQQDIRQLLPGGLTLTKNDHAHLEPLTRAFHLNLFAMGMLAFIVGLFIFYQAMSLSLTQRQFLVGLLCQSGVSGSQLAKALGIELVLWLVIGVVGGNVLGLFLAQKLLPSVATTLSDLYQANIALTTGWHWQWGALSLVIALGGTVMACGWPLVRLIRTQPARLTAHMTMVRGSWREFIWQALVAALFILMAVVIYFLEHNQFAGFVLIGCLLAAAGLLMPFLLWAAFKGLAKWLRSPRLRWFFSDAAASLSYRGVAAMAFMLALAATIGMDTMVGSFRQATQNWLGQRLAADVYVQPSTHQATSVDRWAVRQPQVKAVWWRWRNEVADARHEQPLQVFSIGESAGEQRSLPMKEALDDYWSLLHRQGPDKVFLASESLALRNQWQPGQTVDLPPRLGQGWRLAGIYYDYGNPYGQIFVSEPVWQQLFHREGKVSLAIHLGHDNKAIQMMMDQIQKRFGLKANQVRDHSQIMHQAMAVFDRTFIVTATLGKLTLFVAVGGLFIATIAGEISRQRQFALLRCMGMTGKELALLGGGQLLAIGAMTALIALPLGLLLAQLLIDVVLKYSFGWTMPVRFFPWQYLFSLGTALAALLLAGAWPVWRLVRRSAMLSLREAF
ncbi:FtsX-like permease family protein [Photobacterium galatheae]|uniref:ABC transporter permease n=1 Tax=Photobacterium galatheae TaxID=1654360 RepID=A0A066RVV9_9GAMM|nr:FtsX-like permease family protein [Photobacterium galatheae]KDM91523.1 ABC transporter permease [Photobacterium galatheae]MCM0149596.1 FtsX-like permease family protein [Photobacterium galatheae]